MNGSSKNIFVDQDSNILSESTIYSEKKIENVTQRVSSPNQLAAGKHNPPQKLLKQLIKEYETRDIHAVKKKAATFLKKYPQSSALWNIKGAIADMMEDNDASIEAFQKVTELQPSSYAGFSNLALALKRKGLFDEAITCLEKAIELKPDYAPAHNNIAFILKDKGDFEGALISVKKALHFKADYPEALLNLGNILYALKLIDEAFKCYQMAVKFRPNYAEAINNIALLQKERLEYHEAVKNFQLALSYSPEYAPAYLNLSNTYQQMGELEKAIQNYKTVLEIKPNFAEAHNGLGGIYRQKGDSIQAKVCFEKAIEIQPKMAEAYNNLGVGYKQENKVLDAAKCYQKALEVNPDFVAAYNNLGTLFMDQQKLSDARNSFKNALRVEPSNALAVIKLLQIAQSICDWEECKRLEVRNPELGISTSAVPGFIMLQAEDNPARQLQRSKIWVESEYKITQLQLERKQIADKNARIKVGYFGADFHDHATLFLMAGLLRCHDLSKFEIYIFSYGHHKKGAQRDKLKSQVTAFYDIHDMPNQQVVDLVRSKEIDIAIDLKGYTKYTRSDLFAYRLAPIQINYLGYPSTMGGEFIDYIIADEVIIPKELQQFYSEKIIYLPGSYQPNDNQREIANKGLSRSDFHLPEEGFVMACMNQAYKITDTEYDIWMRVLKEIDGSVLWLLKCNKWAEENLKKEAEKRGVSASRIIIAGALPHAVHLERLKLADLFVDTFRVNAHTTASDALWAGLPVVTKIGQQFAARVAASLLHAVGLPELVARTDEKYEELILNLARDKQQLNKVKEKLKQNIHTTPLFDTESYTKHFENALIEVQERYLGKQPNNHIVVQYENNFK